MSSICEDLSLTDEIIDKVKEESIEQVRNLMGLDLVAVILYGSCARGDYTEDSDIDIAIITVCDRMEVKKYDNGLDKIATDLAMKYFAVVNFVCIPKEEFNEKKSWHAYFRNIEMEGEILYG